jgi:integrase
VYVDPTLGRVPLAEVMADHITRQPYRHNTKVNALNALGHVRDFFGDRPIGAVRPSDLQAFVTSLHLEPRTVATIYQYLRGTLRAAHLDGVIGRDPAQRVKLPRPVDGQIVPPTVADVTTLYESAPDEFAVAVLLGAGLGLRASEAAGLSVDRIDFLRREVRVDRQWHGKLDRFEPVKYEASNRTIPASDLVIDALAMHIDHHGSGEHGLVLHARGRPLNSNRMDWRWTRTARAAESDLTFHELRHHYASSLISAGCSIVAVQRALGHARPSVTLDTYGHLMPSDNDRIRSAIDVAWKAEDSVRTDGHGNVL